MDQNQRLITEITNYLATRWVKPGIVMEIARWLNGEQPGTIEIAFRHTEKTMRFWGPPYNYTTLISKNIDQFEGTLFERSIELGLKIDQFHMVPYLKQRQFPFKQQEIVIQLLKPFKDQEITHPFLTV